MYIYQVYIRLLHINASERIRRISIVNNNDVNWIFILYKNTYKLTNCSDWPNLKLVNIDQPNNSSPSTLTQNILYQYDYI